MTLAEIVGENLRRIRAQRGQSQRDASAFLIACGIPMWPSMVSMLEAGRRRVTIDLLWQLSRAYRLPLSAWFAGDGATDSPIKGRQLSREAVRTMLDGGRDA